MSHLDGQISDYIAKSDFFIFLITFLWMSEILIF